MSRQRTLEQERASFAWQKVSQAKSAKNKKGESIAEEYGSLARGATAEILYSGLGPTLAFWRAKGYENGRIKEGDNQHARLLGDVGDWVMGQLQKQDEVTPEQAGKGLLDWVVNTCTTEQYRRTRAEAIAFLIWVKRFAEAELGEPKKK